MVPTAGIDGCSGQMTHNLSGKTMQLARTGLITAIAVLLIFASGMQSGNSQPAAATTRQGQIQQAAPIPIPATLYVQLTVKTSWKAPCPKDVIRFGEVSLLGPDNKETTLMSINSDLVLQGDCNTDGIETVGRTVFVDQAGTYRLRLDAVPIIQEQLVPIPQPIPTFPFAASVRFAVYNGSEPDARAKILEVDFPPNGAEATSAGFTVGDGDVFHREMIAGTPRTDLVFHFK
jgi:hypothetical protein